ncbi:uncharacterized protein [Procambarus clarkii]|uniref:uncharacterized protein n=1 Tax=Procambarus clarkii TaxID=6728 RepID=UPI001E6728E5|nr:AF4/FMR2 family member lilli-like [Procambarus clarkii]
MPPVPLVVPLLLLLAVIAPAASRHVPPVAADTGRRTLHLPRHAVAAANLDDTYDTSRVRHALRALLDLNDVELQTLMAGTPPGTPAVAPRLAPSTSLFLTSSRQYLQRLHTILSTTQETSTPPRDLPWRPRISSRHRRKKSGPSQRRSSQADTTDTAREESDDILDALREVSAYLAGMEQQQEAQQQQEDEDGQQQQQQQQVERQRRSHRGYGHKHKTVQTHDSTQYESHHYLYYLRAGECPPAPDGGERMFCPSPSQDGRWTCVEDVDLCDGVSQCPNGEDEAPTHCLFHTAMRAHLDELTKFVMLSKLT